MGCCEHHEGHNSPERVDLRSLDYDLLRMAAIRADRLIVNSDLSVVGVPRKIFAMCRLGRAYIEDNFSFFDKSLRELGFPRAYEI